jgi:prevent-host-death family protein
MAIISGMTVSTAEAKNRLTELLRLAERGESVIITRHGRPVAQLGPPPVEKKREVQFGAMRDTIKLYPGWDDPITEEELLGEDV